MMESFQFTGVPVACDETDVDQVSTSRDLLQAVR